MSHLYLAIVTDDSGADMFLEGTPVIRSIWTYYQGCRGYTNLHSILWYSLVTY